MAIRTQSRQTFIHKFSNIIWINFIENNKMFDGQKYLFYNNNEENVFGFCS